MTVETPRDEQDETSPAEPDRPTALEVWDALNEPRPDLEGPVVNDDESPLAAAAAAELARAEAIQQARADAIEEPTDDEGALPADDLSGVVEGADDAAANDRAPAAEPDGPAASPGSDDAPAADATVETDGGATSEPVPGASDGAWSMLGRALRPRMTRAQVLAGVLCALLGFALVVQVRQAGGTNLSSMRQQDLVRILDEVTNRSDDLADESADLRRERDELLSGSDRRQAALDALRRSAETQGILTGRLPAEGPGVVVMLTEPKGAIKSVTMLNMLEELRNAGAEAIELNGQRITASSAFTGTAGEIVLDGVSLTAPYAWHVIGDPDTIDVALRIPGGAMAQVRLNGGEGDVEQREKVEITALRVIPDPVYATPVPSPGD
jgi:uncharacterized protein YlxW (UPF0749 family)